MIQEIDSSGGSPSGNDVRRAPNHPAFLLVGGAIALDFINTRYTANGEIVDRLSQWSDVLDWTSAVGLSAGPHPITPHPPADALTQAIALREAIRSLVLAATDATPPDPRSIETLNIAATHAPVCVRLAWNQEGPRRLSDATHLAPAALLGAIALDAINLFTQRPLDRLRKCACPACVLWFYDISRNGKRRWCSMNGCGNRSKAREYYRRRRAGSV